MKTCPQSLDISCFEENIDYSMNDINMDANHPHYAHGAGKRKSAAACQRLCKATRGCLYFTYDKVNGECYLKSSNEGRATNNDRISGPRSCSKINKG